MNKINNIDMLYIEYTKNCNSKCITCDYWKNNLKQVNIDNEIIDSIGILYNRGLKVVLFTGGEALLEGQRLFDIANKIKQKYPKIHLRLLTNGILVGKYINDITNLFDTIVFSFDTVNKSKYKKMRGVDAFEIVSDNIRKIREKSSKIEIRLRSMLLEENIEELYEIVRYAIDVEVNKLSFLLVDTDSNGFGRNPNSDKNKGTIKNKIDFNEIEKQIIKIKREYSDNDIAKYVIENLNILCKYIRENKITAKTCNAPLTSIVIDSNGYVQPCFFKDSIGNIIDKDIIEIIDSNEYSEIFKQREKRLCKECKKCIL